MAITPSRPAPSKRDSHWPRHLDVPSHRRQVDRRGGIGEQPLEHRAPFGLRPVAEVAAVRREQVEGDKGRRGLARELCDPRSGGVQTELQRVEIESSGGRDHDLAVEHAAWRQPFEKEIVQLRKVAVERTQVAALDEDLGRAAEHDGAEAIPLGLVEQPFAVRQPIHQFCEHRLDRRRDREIRRWRRRFIRR